MDAEAADQLARTLSEGRWTHDYPITAEPANDFGLPVSVDLPDGFVTSFASIHSLAAADPRWSTCRCRTAKTSVTAGAGRAPEILSIMN